MRSERIPIYKFFIAFFCLAMVQYSALVWAFDQNGALSGLCAYVIDFSESPDLHLTDFDLGDDPDDPDDDENLFPSVTHLTLIDPLMHSALNTQIAPNLLNLAEYQVFAFSRTVSLLI